MPKRSLSTSPDAGPSRSKRSHGDTRTPSSDNQKTIITNDNVTAKGISDLFPFQEIFLRILSFLPPNDLAKVQSVSRYWGRMSVDPQLWKRLYLSRYPHPHHSRLIYTSPSASSDFPIDGSASGFSSPRTPRSLRPISRLPSRAFPPPSPKRSPSLSEGHLTPKSPSTSQVAGSKKEGTGYATPVISHSEVSKGKQKESGQDKEEVGHGIRNDGVDWKLMLRLGTNWSNGNALSQTTISLPLSPSPSIQSDTAFSSIPHLNLSPTSTTHQSHNRNAGSSEQHIALSPSYIFISSPLSPLVQVHPSATVSSTNSRSTPLGIIPPPPGWSNPKRPDNVTCIVSDQSVIQSNEDTALSTIPARIAIFYQSGGFVILNITSMSSGLGINWKREFVNPPNTRPKSIKRRSNIHEVVEGDSVVLASLHWPILISCTRDFNLSVYSLATSSSTDEMGNNQISKPKHLQTLKSEISFHPANLTLFPTPPSFSHASTTSNHLDKESIQEEKNENEHFKVSLTYCTPLYPSSWTIAVQEFSIDLTFPNDLDKVKRGDSYHVGSNPYDNENDSEEEEIIWPKRLQPIIGVKGNVIGIGSDGRWCILVGEKENKIQVFSLPHSQHYTEDIDPEPHSNQSSSLGSSVGRRRKMEDMNNKKPIKHSQTLISKNPSSITSLALNSGRCVSSNKDGKILVWELDDLSSSSSSPIQEDNLGRTIGYVEVKKGGRRESIWKGPTGPQPVSHDSDEEEVSDEGITHWPHPQAISSAARSLFLPRPPIELDSKVEDDPPPVRYLTFDEEKIVGIVRTNDVGSRGNGLRNEEEVMKVWSFS